MKMKDFSIKMEIAAKGFKEAANSHFKKCFMVVDEEIVRNTPVDTGLARSNWRASVGSPLNSTIEPYKRGNRLGINETANASDAIAQARFAISSRESGQVAYLTNNVWYIGRLNSGSSTQAGNNFVEKSIALSLARVKAANLFEMSVRK
jgi:hypothetical protein